MGTHDNQTLWVIELQIPESPDQVPVLARSLKVIGTMCFEDTPDQLHLFGSAKVQPDCHAVATIVFSEVPTHANDWIINCMIKCQATQNSENSEKGIEKKQLHKQQTSRHCTLQDACVKFNETECGLKAENVMATYVFGTFSED